MSDTDNTVISVIIVGMGILGLFLGAKVEENIMENRAAKTECAQYHPETGKFEWLQEVSDDTSR